jgi:8-oxo-dGTP diphosphatase
MDLIVGELVVPVDAPEDLIRAAGGVPLRFTGDGRAEVACVYREARGDWTFPKGKLAEGESFEECALREVLEETGLVCDIGPFIGTTNYIHRKGRPKVVAYYLMTALGGEFIANDEVDELRWVPLQHVREVLTWERDQELLDLVLSMPEVRAQAS